VQLQVARRVDEFKSKDWNQLVGNDYPFLRHEFLNAAETSGSVSAQTGWQPCHLGLRNDDGKLVAAMPLYEKSHSWGEFVFDWSWAQAYERAGLDYYPKLVACIPFTPATSSRLLSASIDDRQRLLEAALQYARDESVSSLHLLFPRADELDELKDAGFTIRTDCQFHWQNNNYSCFDDFIASFSSSKRKKARRDRRRVAEQGITFRHLKGQALDAALWSEVYELISITFLRRGSMPYFSLEFFIEVSRAQPDSILVVLAEKGGSAIAAAVFFDSEQTLYGRYWGAAGHYDALHFETCYYQGIDYCIAHKRARFEPGTQGEHKISRGFLPETTWSAHWLERPEFFSAIEQYLDHERQHVERYVDAVQEHSPYRNKNGDSQV